MTVEGGIMPVADNTPCVAGLTGRGVYECVNPMIAGLCAGVNAVLNIVKRR